MLRSIRNRIVFSNLVLVTVIAAGLLLVLTYFPAVVDDLPTAILTAAVVAILLSLFLSSYQARVIARPLQELTRTVERIAEGDLSTRLPALRQDEVGKLTGAVNVMSDRLARQLTELHHEQDRLSSVLNHMADGALFVGADGRIELINPAAARLLGVEQKWALGASFAQVVRDHRLMDLWQICRTQRQEMTQTLESFADDRLLRVFLTPIPFDRSDAPATVHAPGFLLILQDLTQVRRLETARRDFVSNISHELRTPLASLRALADTLRDGALDDPPAAVRFLDRMDVEVDSLTQMVQELLELSRIESGQVPFRLQPTDLRPLIQAAIERLAAQADRAQVHLSAELPASLPASLPPALADGDRLAQVLTNLIHNAIKFTDAGGRIQVRAYVAPVAALHGARRLGLTLGDPQTLLAVVEVADTGIGIPSQDLPRIFERFYKTDRARASGGTGLGLAIAKHVIQAHHGHIWATSRLGQGSTFTFVLPLAG